VIKFGYLKYWSSKTSLIPAPEVKHGPILTKSGAFCPLGRALHSVKVSNQTGHLSGRTGPSKFRTLKYGSPILAGSSSVTRAPTRMKFTPPKSILYQLFIDV